MVSQWIHLAVLAAGLIWAERAARDQSETSCAMLNLRQRGLRQYACEPNGGVDGMLAVRSPRLSDTAQGAVEA